MNIYPSDIDPEGQKAIEGMRRIFPGDVSELSRSRRAGVPFYAVLTVLILGLIAYMSSHAIVWLILSFVGLVVTTRRVYLRSRNPAVPTETPLFAHEIQYLLQAKKENLKRSYWNVVKQAIDAPAADDEEVELHVREAIHTLGASFTDLPAPASVDAVDDPDVLLRESERLKAKAAHEPDSIITASLLRRVEALDRQAETARRTLLLTLRNEALREELAVQVGALRTSLNAFKVGGSQGNISQLAEVAASIQSISIEAKAISDARNEIDLLTNEVQTTSPHGEPLKINIGRTP